MDISVHCQQERFPANGVLSGFAGMRVLTDDELNEVAGGHVVVSTSSALTGSITQGDFQTNYYSVTDTYSDGSTYTYQVSRTFRISKTI